MSLVGKGRGTGAAGGHRHIPLTPQVMEAVKAENQTALLVINIKYIVSSPVKGDCIYFIKKELKFARGAQGAEFRSCLAVLCSPVLCPTIQVTAICRRCNAKRMAALQTSSNLKSSNTNLVEWKTFLKPFLSSSF